MGFYIMLSAAQCIILGRRALQAIQATYYSRLCSNYGIILFWTVLPIMGSFWRETITQVYCQGLQPNQIINPWQGVLDFLRKDKRPGGKHKVLHRLKPVVGKSRLRRSARGINPKPIVLSRLKSVYLSGLLYCRLSYLSRTSFFVWL